MTQEITKQKVKFSVALQSDTYQKLINTTLGDKQIAQRFIAEISTAVALNPRLNECEPATILSAGLMAQTLGLSLSSSLGQTYIIPYKDKAQIQIGWKGLVQLALRTNQVERLNAIPIYEGEVKGIDMYGEVKIEFNDFATREKGKVIGYLAIGKLVSGYRKSVYWTVEKCEKHAKTYSKSYKYNSKDTNVWRDDFDAMALKTVMKQLLNKGFVQNAEVQKALQIDQAIINKDGSIEYVDNDGVVDAEINPDDKISGIEFDRDSE